MQEYKSQFLNQDVSNISDANISCMHMQAHKHTQARTNADTYNDHVHSQKGAKIYSQNIFF